MTDNFIIVDTDDESEPASKELYDQLLNKSQRVGSLVVFVEKMYNRITDDMLYWFEKDHWSTTSANNFINTVPVTQHNIRLLEKVAQCSTEYVPVSFYKKICQ